MLLPTARSAPVSPRRPSVSALVVAVLVTLPMMGCWPSSSSSTSSAAPPAGGSGSFGAVIARVNGVEIRETDLAAAEEDIGSDIENIPADQRRDQLVAYVSDMILVAKAAETQKVSESADFQQRLTFLRNKLLMGVQLQAVAKDALTEDAMREVYDSAVRTAGSEEEVRARHILVATQEEANEIVTALRGGADFAALAKEKSKDPGAAEGGDLGYFTKDQMVPEFADVAFKMYAGQLSNPVKTQFGWHVIKVEDRRNKPVPTFEQVKNQIQTFLARKAQSEYVGKLRETAKIERLDKPAAPPAATPAPADPMKK